MAAPKKLLQRFQKLKNPENLQFENLENEIEFRAYALETNCRKTNFIEISEHNIEKIFSGLGKGDGGVDGENSFSEIENEKITSHDILKMLAIKNEQYSTQINYIEKLAICVPFDTGLENWKNYLFGSSKTISPLKNDKDLEEKISFFRKQKSIKRDELRKGDFSSVIKKERWIGSIIADYLNDADNFDYRILQIQHPFSRLLDVYEKIFRKPEDLVERQAMATFIRTASGNNNGIQLGMRVADFTDYIREIRLIYNDDSIKDNSYPFWITFENFLYFLVQIDRHNDKSKNPQFYQMNPLWAPISRLCDPCSLSYNYIFRKEDFDSDMDQFILENYDNLSIINGTESGSNNDNYNSQENSKSQKSNSWLKKVNSNIFPDFLSYWNHDYSMRTEDKNGFRLVDAETFHKIVNDYKISQRLLEQIYQVYYYDFVLFGYSISQFF